MSERLSKIGELLYQAQKLAADEFCSIDVARDGGNLEESAFAHTLNRRIIHALALVEAGELPKPCPTCGHKE